MTSIIKVDQIQNAAGGTPTAADLGLNTLGSIINVYHTINDTQSQPGSTAWLDSGLEITLTPVSSASKFLINANQFIYNVQYTSWAGDAYRFLRDTTVILDNPYGYATGAMHSKPIMRRSSADCLDSPSTTSQITYKFQLQAQIANYSYWNYANVKSTMTIYEIAG